MPSSFEVNCIWLYHSLVLITGLCGFPGHSQIFIKNSDMWLTATQDLSKKTLSTFLQLQHLPECPSNLLISQFYDFLHSRELPLPPEFYYNQAHFSSNLKSSIIAIDYMTRNYPLLFYHPLCSDCIILFF